MTTSNQIQAPFAPQTTAADRAGACDCERKRSAFLDFLESFFPSSAAGVTAATAAALASTDEDQQALAELLSKANGNSNAAVPATATPEGVINDLPGLLATSGSRHTDQQRPLQHHRAVVTSMPMPATTRGAAAAAGGAQAQDDDTTSVVTLPMPNRKRRRSDEEDEACSSPNDLVEVPHATQAAAAARKRQAAAPQHSHRDVSSARRDQQQQQPAAANTSGAGGGAAPAAAAAAAAPSSGGSGGKEVKRGILVSKVLTKSDSNSRRVILPRIAVETNLPQLASAPHFHFTATDPTGASWPLVIKAWANGSNPKPVYVMEMIGDVLKQHRLTIGDAIALLADEEGRFFLEWNTQAAHAAAARPTYSGIVFKTAGDEAAAAEEDDSGDAADDAEPATQQQQPAKQQQQQEKAQQPAAPQAPPQQPQPQQQSAAPQATAAAAGRGKIVPGSSPFAAVAASAAPEAAPVATASNNQQQQQALPPLQRRFTRSSSQVPLMTAVPVTSPQLPGHFIPTSPCQLLVVGHMPMPDLDLELANNPLQPSLPSGMLGNLNSNGDVVLPPTQTGYGYGGSSSGLEGRPSASDEGLLVPVTAGGSQLAHAAGGVLLCPRTPGCTRPAGHQGWCLGHKGYKKRKA